jgi:hypothetical protein
MEAKMAYLARPSDFHGAAPYKAATLAPARTPHPLRRGFWRALIDAITLSRQNEAQREVEAYVARRGKLTDSMEREIAERFITGNWGPRQ